MAAAGTSVCLSCRHVGAPVASSPSFAVYPDANKWLLPKIAKTSALNACIVYQGNVKPTSFQIRAKENSLAVAVIKWNAALKRANVGWKIDAVALKTLSGIGQCPAANYDMTILVWTDSATWNRDHAKGQRSYADVNRGEIHLDPEAFDGLPSGDLRQWVIVHEYGHLLGLGDTYTEKGESQPQESHPPSVYRGEGGTWDPSPDDIAGIGAVWKYIETGSFSCPQGYKKGTGWANGGTPYYCVPE
jgi:hypothetical protein